MVDPIQDVAWKRKAALFLSSQGLSLFGSMLVQYAIIWHLTLTTESGAGLMLATLAGFLPQIAISLFAGVWADRHPRRLLIIGSDVLTATSTLVLALFFLFGYRELWLILLVSAIRSVGAGIQAPAVNALIPQIVPEDRLMKVNSIDSTIQPVIMIAAPLVAGALLGLSRLEYIFFIDVLTALLAVGLLLLLKTPPQPRAASEQPVSYLADMREGLAYIRGNRTIMTLFIFFGFIFFLITPVAFLSPLLVARSYGEEPWRLVANEVAFFGGSILGGLIMTAWGGFKNRFHTIGLACILWAVLFTGLGLTSNFYVYLALMTLSGIPMPFWNASATTLLQELVPGEMQGRVFGVQGLIASSVMPVGMLLFGPISDVVAIEIILVAASALMAIPGLWLYLAGRKLHIPSPAGDMQLEDCVEC